MNYQIRQATTEDIRPALHLALRVFMEYDSQDYGPEHTERMRLSIEERIANPDIYFLGNRLMFVALDDKKVLNSSPNGLLFYRHFGFTIIETDKNINTPWKTPMSYTLN